MPQKLSPSQVRRAIQIYLEHAYTGQPPSAVRLKLETLQALPDSEFYACALFERDVPISPSKLSLRLGNRFYPHMKLTIERRPDKQGYLFRADTHDRHISPPLDPRERNAFTKLMEQNQQLAQSIESAWAESQLPTFKTYLREDLARRRGEKP